MPILILTIADSKAQTFARPDGPFASAMARLPKDAKVIVTEDPAKLRENAPDADVIFYAHVRPALLTDIIPLAKRARWIHSLWTGVEGILGPESRAHSATLTNGRGVFRWPLADWVTGVMLYFAFDFRRVIQQQEKELWKPVIGKMLDGQTLGVVGYGAIGSAIATRARVFGMKIAALRRRPELFEGDALVDHPFGAGQLQELMALSDYIVSVTPLTNETRGLIGKDEIARMKPSAVFINIGRGPVVDEAALTEALEAGRIRGAALDVFDTEPLPAGHPFWKMPQVLLSPHTADRVEDFLVPAFDCFVGNAQRFFEGLPLLNVVDKDGGY
jgi:phosphoglycerate dehydrogenase-like enzyme